LVPTSKLRNVADAPPVQTSEVQPAEPVKLPAAAAPKSSSGLLSGLTGFFAVKRKNEVHLDDGPAKYIVDPVTGQWVPTDPVERAEWDAKLAKATAPPPVTVAVKAKTPTVAAAVAEPSEAAPVTSFKLTDPTDFVRDFVFAVFFLSFVDFFVFRQTSRAWHRCG
jgi:hypothetical protein